MLEETSYGSLKSGCYMNNNFENYSTFCFKNYNNSYKKEKRKRGTNMK
jgi:hypothetical protein